MLIKIIKNFDYVVIPEAKRAGEHEMEKEKEKLVEKDQSGGFLLHSQKEKI